MTDVGMPSPPPQPVAAPRRAGRSRLPRWRSPSAWTLRAKLVASVLALFAVISIASGAFTVLALDTYLTRQVDAQLQSSIGRFDHGPGQPPSDDAGRRGPGDEGLQAYLSTTGAFVSLGTASDRTSGLVALTSAELAALAGAGLPPEPTTIQLGGRLGSYRVLVKQGQVVTRDGAVFPAVVVVGLPRASQEATIGNMVRIAAAGINPTDQTSPLAPISILTVDVQPKA